MAESYADLIGMIAGVLTTLAFIPQVVKTLRSRQTRDISLAMWILFTVGLVLWTIYGIILNSLPIIAANLVTLVLAGVILTVKITNRHNER